MYDSSDLGCLLESLIYSVTHIFFLQPVNTAVWMLPSLSLHQLCFSLPQRQLLQSLMLLLKRENPALPPAASALFSRSLPLRQIDREGSGFLSVILRLCSVPSGQRMTEQSIRSQISEPGNNSNRLWESSVLILTTISPFQNIWWDGNIVEFRTRHSNLKRRRRRRDSGS